MVNKKIRIKQNIKYNKYMKMTGISIYISIINMNINDFISPMKRHRWANWTKKTKSNCFLPAKIHITGKYTHRLSLKNTLQANRN
jgi:hypothetical protein